MIETTGKTPQNTLASVIYMEIKKDPQCIFVKVAPMTFGLRTFDNLPPEALLPNLTPSQPKSKRRKKKEPVPSNEVPSTEVVALDAPAATEPAQVPSVATQQ
jgi:hypothetical protein